MNIIKCWYDEEKRALYCYIDGRYYRYDRVSLLQWHTLKTTRTINVWREITEYLSPSIVATPPKGLTPIELFDDDAVRMYDVNSSNVKAAGYDADAKRLYIQFLSRGNPVYSYENVPLSMWQALEMADSKGSWVHWFLVVNDGTFPYKRDPAANLYYTGETLHNAGTPHKEGYLVDSNWF